jgi:hypothetical protein
VWSKKIYIVRYGFGNTSGRGFGSSIIDDQSENSSNFREFGNFVIRLERDAMEGKMKGAEIFMFTDNSTAEAAYHNGTSNKSKIVQVNAETKKAGTHARSKASLNPCGREKNDIPGGRWDFEGKSSGRCHGWARYVDFCSNQ